MGNEKRARKSEKFVEIENVLLFTRIITIGITSFLAEKTWRYRSHITQHWYTDAQTAMEQSMIVIFEYIILMGLLFFTGVAIGKLVLACQSICNTK